MRKWLFPALCSILLFQCAAPKTLTRWPASVLPKPDQEFRAAWVASVANINWPSKPGLPVSDQQAEALALLDLLKENGYNAVIFQVRPQCDALYESGIEPWSYYLTGHQGTAPDPFYDPLTFWIEAAHDRGLELHAWLNPYRAHHTSGGQVSDKSIVNTNPDLVVQLANGYWWLIPTHDETQNHSFAVVMDLVSRYDLDGLHFDDYFYPYPSYNDDEEFPDSVSWKNYLARGGKLSRGDWRRNAVNDFIKRVYKGIKKEMPHVKFGISPFGIWRPNHPASIQGFDQYGKLYADAKLWLNKGWIDYWTPQLYWPINQVPQSFPVLLDWWIQENTRSRPIWPGMSIGRKKGAEASDEVINQIMISRGMLPENQSGTVHWSIGPLITTDSLVYNIRSGPYKNDALVPTMTHLPSRTKIKPVIDYQLTSDSIELTWKIPDGQKTSAWLLYTQYDAKWQLQILNRNMCQVTLPRLKVNPATPEERETLTNVALIHVDRTGHFSATASIAPLEKIAPAIFWTP